MPTHIADRLTRDERMKLYQWAGEGYTTREIVRMFNDSQPGLAKIRVPGVEKILAMPEAHKFVAKFRIEFLKSVKEIPIAQKAVRLDDLEKMRQRLSHIAFNCHVDRSPKELSKFLMASKRLIEIIELARNEMEQRPGVAIGIGINQGDLGDLTDEQLKNERDELLRKTRNAIKRGITASDEVAEGDEAAGPAGSSEILLAPSEELRRDELPKREPDVPNV